MKKLALITLLGISGISHAAYVAVDASPVRRDIVAQDPALTGTMSDGQQLNVGNNATEPMVTPADNNYYYTPYGNRPVANTVAGATGVAADAVETAGEAAAAVIPF